MRYTGRFAPSPTGALHLGSLLAALGSYLDARSRGGRWLVRIEDLDRARVVPGSADDILRTLDHFGLQWDGDVVYQSRRGEAYAAAIAALEARGLSYPCSCSRRGLAARSAWAPSLAAAASPAPDLDDSEGPAYPGTCREGPTGSGPMALRFRIDDAAAIAFEDGIQGPVSIPLTRSGDVIVRRRDGIVAYQLAVVVDDAWQDITHIVRGADLLPSTAWQVALQRALGLPTPAYAHLPLVVEPDGTKLSKARRSVSISDAPRPGATLAQLLSLMRQDPPAALGKESPVEVLDWAVSHWQSARLRGIPIVRTGKSTD